MFRTGAIVFNAKLSHHSGMMTSVDAKPGRKLADDIRERLLKRIRRGEFSPGDALPSERDLMRIKDELLVSISR